MKTSNASNAGYAILKNDTIATTYSNSEISTTSTSYERVRNTVDIYPEMPFTSINIDTQLKNASTDTTTVSTSWLVLQYSSIPTSGTSGGVELYNKTDTVSVSNSEVTSTDSGYSVVRSDSITLTTNKEYEVRIKEVVLQNAKIVHDQTDSTNGVYAVETVQQFVNSLATDSDTGYTDQDYVNQFDPNNDHYEVANFNNADIYFVCNPY